jgi:hypothetical protein
MFYSNDQSAPPAPVGTDQQQLTPTGTERPGTRYKKALFDVLFLIKLQNYSKIMLFITKNDYKFKNRLI